MKRLLLDEMANRQAVSGAKRANTAAKLEDAPMKKKRSTTVVNDLYDADFPHDVITEEEAVPAGGGADDALGLYLKQMGAIPLLNREKELSLATRLEKARQRYRRAT